MIELLLALCLSSGYCESAMVESLEEWEPRIEIPSAYHDIGSNVEQWRDLVSVYFRPEDVDTTLCLMRYESGGNPHAWSDTDDHGLMQVNYYWWGEVLGVTRTDLYDPETNLWAAAQVRDRQGWTAWSPWNRGLCHE